MSAEFKYCPQCESDDIEETDYELADGSEDEDGRRCRKCNWEGDVSELHCKRIKPHNESNALSIL